MMIVQYEDEEEGEECGDVRVDWWCIKNMNFISMLMEGLRSMRVYGECMHAVMHVYEWMNTGEYYYAYGKKLW